MGDGNKQDASNTASAFSGDRAQRGLPEGQRKLDPEVDEDDDLDLQTVEAAERISTHFEDIHQNTIDDDRVMGTVASINWSKNNTKVAVEVALPAQKHPERFYFDEPRVWTDRYEFVRWVRKYDHDADNLANMIDKGTEVELIHDDNDGDYELIIPDAPRTLRSRAAGAIRWVTTPLRLIADDFAASELAVIGPFCFIGMFAFPALLFDFFGWAVTPGDAVAMAGLLVSALVGTVAFTIAGTVLHEVYFEDS